LRVAENSDPFVALRSGLMNHLEKGKMSFRNEFPVFCTLLLLADRKDGTVLTNAKILAERMGEKLNVIQFALYKLREKQYIYYADNRGFKRPYTIFINKYRIWITKDISVYTSIFRENQFIGEVGHFARLKVCNLYPKMRAGYRLSFQSFRLSTDFTIDFATDFKRFIQDIDLYTSNNLINNALIDFPTDFTLDNPQTLIVDAYKEIYIYIKKAVSPVSPKNDPDELDKKRIASLCEQLQNLNHGFNPFFFIQWNIKAKIPFQVTEYILHQLVQYKPTHAWPYAMAILKKEYQHRNYAAELLKHEELKQFDMVEAIKNVKVVD
jgi:hypothetical protein